MNFNLLYTDTMYVFWKWYLNGLHLSLMYSDDVERKVWRYKMIHTKTLIEKGRTIQR